MAYIVSPSRIEPARLEDGIPLDLVETANRLIQSSRGLGRNLPARTLADLAAMVRMMNSYYSNRIEGNNTVSVSWAAPSQFLPDLRLHD